MRVLFILLALISFNVSAQGVLGERIDDLGTVSLKGHGNSVHFSISLPGYRIGGGAGTARPIQDCLYLDTPLSDSIATIDQKMDLAGEINVFDEEELLEPEIKGNHVVYKIVSYLAFVAAFKVESKSGEGFFDIMLRQFSHDEVGAPIKLIYVRDCRF